MINFSKDTGYNNTTRFVAATYRGYTLAFGVFRWPWVSRSWLYRTLISDIIDNTGILRWLVNIKRVEQGGEKRITFRVLCVGVGLKWQVQP